MLNEERDLVNGNDIKLMRECAGKSAMEVAASLGMDTSARYYKWENDQEVPDMNEFLRLSQVCGIDPVQLITVLSNKKGDLQLEDLFKMRSQLA